MPEARWPQDRLRRRRWSKTARLAASAVALTLLLAACTGQESVDRGSPGSGSPGVPSDSGGQGDVPQIRSEADLDRAWAFPLEAFALTDTQASLIWQASLLLAGKCMAEKGFTWSPYTVREEFPSENKLVSAFGVGMLSEVQQYGYATPPKYAPPKPSSAPPSQLPDDYAAYEEAMYGPAERRPEETPVQIGDSQMTGMPTYTADSCQGVANEAISLSLARYRELPLSTGSPAVVVLMGEARDRTNADSRVGQVTQEWSACMAARGFTIAYPNERSVDPPDDAAAIAEATADVECKYETNYFGVMYAVLVEHQEALIDEGLTGLETLAAENEEILEKANAAIEAG